MYQPTLHPDTLTERKRILEAERDTFIQQANERLAVYNGALGELAHLLKLLLIPDDETAVG